jgi:predicted alpha/beta hydrolase
MASDSEHSRPVTIPARDGYPLAGRVFDGSGDRVVVISSATAVPQRFYRHFATALAEAGYTAITYDYRGIELTRPRALKELEATAREWALEDLPGALDWAAAEFSPARLFLVGHSFGGQVAGMYDRPALISGMVTMSAQSGHWRLQGGGQKLLVWLHTHLTLPLLSRLFGYMPMKLIGAGEDLPAGVAREWASWCRHRDYILGDDSLPLDRYRSFNAPVLAYSFSDDNWGTARSVESMMRAYPNVEYRHVEPSMAGLGEIGHLGFFRPASGKLWADAFAWLDRQSRRGMKGRLGASA